MQIHVQHQLCILKKNMCTFKYKLNLHGIHGISNLNFVYYSTTFMIASNIHLNRSIYQIATPSNYVLECCCHKLQYTDILF